MIDFATAPPIVQRFRLIVETHAVDVILRHRYLYYIAAEPTISDHEYDCLEWFLRYQFPRNAVINGVGSSTWEDYPTYVREGRRPQDHERDHYHPRLLKTL